MVVEGDGGPGGADGGTGAEVAPHGMQQAVKEPEDYVSQMGMENWLYKLLHPVFSFLGAYGWYIVAAALVLGVLYSFLKPTLKKALEAAPTPRVTADPERVQRAREMQQARHAQMVAEQAEAKKQQAAQAAREAREAREAQPGGQPKPPSGQDKPKQPKPRGFVADDDGTGKGYGGSSTYFSSSNAPSCSIRRRPGGGGG